MSGNDFDTPEMCVPQGSFETFRFTLVDDAGAAVDLTPYVDIRLQVADGPGSSPFITKTIGSGIAIIGAPTAGIFEVTFDGTDTSGVTPGTYKYDVWADQAASADFAIIGLSDFVVLKKVTTVP